MSFPDETVNIKLYGAFRTFTNAAAWLLDHYLESPDGKPVRTWHHGPGGEEDLHKHLPPHPANNVAGYVLCVKHPVTWANSMRRYLMNANQGEPDSRVLATLWSFQSDALLKFAASHNNAVLVRYETAMKHPKDMVSTCAKRFGLQAAPNARWSEQRMGRASDTLRHLLQTKDYPEVVPMPESALQQFRLFCDRRVCEQTGYKL